jgi:hypothetical protein
MSESHITGAGPDPDLVLKLIGQSDFVNSTEGGLFISMPFVSGGGEIDVVALQQVFASFGDLRSFELIDRDSKVSLFSAKSNGRSPRLLNPTPVGLPRRVFRRTRRSILA